MSEPGPRRGSAQPPVVHRVSIAPAALRELAYREPRLFPILLDSSASGPLGRYSILAAFPQAALWMDGHGGMHRQGSLLARGSATRGGTGERFLDALQQAWQEEAQPEHARAPGPFHGGWMVFLGYELCAEIEPKLVLPPSGPGVGAPTAFALRIPVALVFDHLADEAWIIAEADHAPLAGDLETRLSALAAGAPAPPSFAAPQWGPLQEEEPALFRARVESALEYIRAGDIYQANLSRAWRAQLTMAEPEPSALAAATARLYERLRATNPAPFAALARFADWALLCSSPERLIASSGGRVQTRPIAGTYPRSPGRSADERERSALIAHPKERAEHVMLIDLERNDLGRICQPGSVRVDELMVTESYAHVHHIVSNVSGQLREGVTPVEALRAVFPGGTITGCPKFRCMQIIAELEREMRGAYTGALGFINHDGSMDFNILIRSLVLVGSRLELRAGAGIVADSDWQRELAETRAKARGPLAALQEPLPNQGERACQGVSPT